MAIVQPPQIGTLENPATSCTEISDDRPSGIYWLKLYQTPQLLPLRFIVTRIEQVAAAIQQEDG